MMEACVYKRPIPTAKLGRTKYWSSGDNARLSCADVCTNEAEPEGTNSPVSPKVRPSCACAETGAIMSTTAMATVFILPPAYTTSAALNRPPRRLAQHNGDDLGRQLSCQRGFPCPSTSARFTTLPFVPVFPFVLHVVAGYAPLGESQSPGAAQ